MRPPLRRRLGSGPDRPVGADPSRRTASDDPAPSTPAAGPSAPPDVSGPLDGSARDEAAPGPDIAAETAPASPETRKASPASRPPSEEETAGPAQADPAPSPPRAARATGGSRAQDGEPPPPDLVGEAPQPPADPAVPAENGDRSPSADDGRFTVVLDNFEGPFDLLLQLISRHKLDVTEVALSRVTDDFMAHIRAMGADWDLDQTTEFLVVAATLLDLKAARLLPAAEVEDEADLALLEARDLLFARLLQYRAYKRIADIFQDRMSAEALCHPRTVGLEPHHAELLPEVVLTIGGEGLARLAVKAMQAKPPPQVYVEHIHAPLVSVREQAEVVVARLRELGEATFDRLTEDAPDTLTVVARFLALLELYREKAVALDQEEALGRLTVRWSGAATDRPLVTDEFDRPPEPVEEATAAGSGGSAP